MPGRLPWSRGRRQLKKSVLVNFTRRPEGHTVILNDSLKVFLCQSSQSSLERRPSLVRENNAGVHHGVVKESHSPEVGLQAVTNQDVLGVNLEEELCLNISEAGGDPQQVLRLDPAEPGVVVHDVVLRHHQALVTRRPRVVDHRNTTQLATHRRVDHLAVQGEHLPLSLLLPLLDGGDEAPHVVEVRGVGDVTGRHLAALGLRGSVTTTPERDRAGY